MYTGFQAESPLFLSDFIRKIEFSQQIFEKYSNITFHENPILWEPRCSMRKDVRKEMTKLTVAFRNFANAPKHVRGEQLINRLMLQPEHKPTSLLF